MTYGTLRGFVAGVALVALLPPWSIAQAQNVSEEVRRASVNIISSISPATLENRRLWSLERPLTFSLLDNQSSQQLSLAIEEMAADTFGSQDCIEKHLNSIESNSVTNPELSGEERAAAIGQVERNFLAESGLSEGELERYKRHRDAYQNELKRLETLPSEQAQAESYKLKQLEDDWQVFGQRSAFLEMERQIAESTGQEQTKIDVVDLRQKMYDEGRLVVNFSVPVEQWTAFDSWIFHSRRTTNVASFRAELISQFEIDGINSGGCVEGGCDQEWTAEILETTAVRIELLAPRIDLPWLSEFLLAVSSLGEVSGECQIETVPERLVIVRGVGADVDFNLSDAFADALAAGDKFSIDGLQFSGTGDIGIAFSASPRFENGYIVSPFYHVVGLTSVAIPSSQ